MIKYLILLFLLASCNICPTCITYTATHYPDGFINYDTAYIWQFCDDMVLINDTVFMADYMIITLTKCDKP